MVALVRGACHPFVVLTDYRNLEYLREARRLKPDGSFSLLTSTLPSHIIQGPCKNIKGDALYRLHSLEETAENIPIILPCLTDSPIQWSLEESIKGVWREGVDFITNLKKPTLTVNSVSGHHFPAYLLYRLSCMLAIV